MYQSFYIHIRNIYLTFALKYTLDYIDFVWFLQTLIEWVPVYLGLREQNFERPTFNDGCKSTIELFQITKQQPFFVDEHFWKCLQNLFYQVNVSNVHHLDKIILQHQVSLMAQLYLFQVLGELIRLFLELKCMYCEPSIQIH